VKRPIMHGRRMSRVALAACALIPAMIAPAMAGDPAAPAPPSTNSGDTSWLLMSAALVMLMTPGLAFFYGGLVRKKNVLSVLMQCLMALCVVSLQWVLFGYSLAFGPDKGGFIGGLEWFGLAGVGQDPDPAGYAPTVPHLAFMIFQLMFAVITPALIIGAFAERMKFAAYTIFSLLWATIVYDPVAHWVWGSGGFLRAMGALDFAGGTVVHINAGVAALAAALAMGRRQGFPDGISPPHHLPFAVLGAGLLWFGWFGFNAGSALSAAGLASSAFVATHTAAATAGLVWALLDRAFHKKPTTLGMITGVVAGLVSITPAAGFVTPMGAIGIGIGAAVLPWCAVTFLKTRLGYDDSLDAFGVHGIGGIWGAIATGIWATRSVNPNGADGLLAGNPAQLWIQIKATAITGIYSLILSFVIFKLVERFVGLRVTEHEERVGLDLTLHKEAAYTIVD